MLTAHRAFVHAASPRNSGGQAITPAQNPPFKSLGMGGMAQSVAPIGEAHRYMWVVRGRASCDGVANSAINYAPGTAVLQSNNQLRNFLYLKVPKTSLTSVGVCFGTPVDVANPDYEIFPGGYFGWDVVVPQDDIYIIGMGGAGVTAVLQWNYSTVNIKPDSRGT